MGYILKCDDCVDISAVTELKIDDAEDSVGGRHARFNVYCVKLEALNLAAMSAIFVCTTQTYTEKSTAKHADDSRHIFRHSDSDVYGYSIPFDDATPSCLLHISHPAKNTHIRNNNNISTHYDTHTRQLKWTVVLRNLQISQICHLRIILPVDIVRVFTVVAGRRAERRQSRCSKNCVTPEAL